MPCAAENAPWHQHHRAPQGSTSARCLPPSHSSQLPAPACLPATAPSILRLRAPPSRLPPPPHSLRTPCCPLAPLASHAEAHLLKLWQGLPGGAAQLPAPWLPSLAARLQDVSFLRVAPLAHNPERLRVHLDLEGMLGGLALQAAMLAHAGILPALRGGGASGMPEMNTLAQDFLSHYAHATAAAAAAAAEAPAAAWAAGADGAWAGEEGGHSTVEAGWGVPVSADAPAEQQLQLGIAAAPAAVQQPLMHQPAMQQAAAMQQMAAVTTYQPWVGGGRASGHAGERGAARGIGG